MTPLMKPIFLCCGVMIVSSFGAQPPSSNDTSDYPVLSPAVRLGIKFSPPPPNDENTAVAPRGPTIGYNDSISPGTVLLTPFVVTEPRVKLKEKRLLTDKGRLAVAEKECLTPLYRVSFGPLSQLATYYFDWLSILGGWHPNEIEARELYREEERLKMLSDLDNLVRLETTLNAKDTKQFQGIRFGAGVLSR